MFPLSTFDGFCSNLRVDTKEEGPKLLAPKYQLGTQRYFIEEVARGIEEGIHYFVVLKGRQLGITTISAALDLFWHYKYDGMQGTFAAHDEEARDNFRSMLTMYHEGLPRAYRKPLLQNNRYFISFKNRSKISMQIGGAVQKRSSGGKGRGQAFTFVHGTEVSSWSNEEQLGSMLASLAQVNPRRLYIWESTARGYNMFHSMWKDAQQAVTQRAIFIGWWRNQFYSKPQGSNEYRVYWDGRLTPTEREWVREIKLTYKYEMTAEQMAWWRWMCSEGISDRISENSGLDGESLMNQEFPHTARYAFQLTGKNFFAVAHLDDIAQRIKDDDEPRYYKFQFGDAFTDTSCDETIEQLSDLAVWEEPDDRGFYVLGADPAYGSSDWADRFVISVWRCYADRFEQVAEYCVTDLSTYKYAWVLCYLAGAYKQSMINLEVNGPGQAVLAEVNNLRRMASSMPRAEGGAALTNVLRHIQYYLYRRLDSPGGAGFAWHTKTTHDMKERMLNNLRDLMYRGAARVHSEELVEEMKIIVREDDGFLGASGRGKDDRVIAAALAAVHYVDQIKNRLDSMRITWRDEAARRAKQNETGVVTTPQQDTLSRSIKNYLQAAGIKE